MRENEYKVLVRTENTALIWGAYNNMHVEEIWSRVWTGFIWYRTGTGDMLF
jgi:hypothetical protein